MRKVKINIEFLEPEIRKRDYPDELAIEEAEKERTLLPGRILNQILEILEDAGVEIISFQKQEVPDYMSKIIRDMDSRERMQKKDTVKIM